MIGEPIISIIMVTIGLSLVMRSLVTAIWGNDILVYEPKLFPQETVSIGGGPVSQEFIWCFVLSMVLLAVFSAFFKYSKAGVAMRATAFNQQAAQSMGISVKHIFAPSWVIAAARCGIGGGEQNQRAPQGDAGMHYCGDFRTAYRKDMEIFQTPFIKVCMAVFLVFLLVLPVLKLEGEYFLKGEYLWILLQIL